MINKLSFTLLVSLLLFAGISNAQTKYSAKSHQVLVSGTSNVHDWSSKATSVTVTADFGLANGNFDKINSASVKIESKSLKSTKNSDIMDERTYSTLKVEKYPTMTYVVTKIVSSQVAAGESTVTVSGNLTIAGVTKPSDLVLKIKNLPGGDIEVKGSRKVLMSNHGIKPPSFMFGAMKVADEVTITFDVVLKKS